MESNFVNVMLFVYPLALVAISVIIYSHLPHFTYKDATAIVIQETFEKIDYTKQNKIEGQNGMYFIYTEENVYVFNAKDGLYSKRIK